MEVARQSAVRPLGSDRFPKPSQPGRYARDMTEEHAARISAEAATTIIDGLVTDGVMVIDNALPSGLVDALWSRAQQHPIDEFALGGVGRDENRRHDSLRNDLVLWLDPDDATTRWYFAWIESLRLELNRALFLGLFDYECHLACYPVGSFYRRHLDAFRGGASRRVSTVLYLNREWSDDDGGPLVLYRPETPEPRAQTGSRVPAVRSVTPLYGRLVVFLSEEIPHEVLPARRARFSIAGWFRVASSARTPSAL